MPISDRFAKLIEHIAPSDADVRAYEQHLATVSAVIKRELNTNRVEPIGSYARRTAVRRVSDLDVLAVLNAKERRWGDDGKSSRTVLNNVRLALSKALPATAIGTDRNAVVVQFKGGERPIDVVPAFYAGPAKQFRNYPLFRIPNGRGGWLTTSPSAHAKYLQEDYQRSRGKSVRLAQIIKFWASCHPHVQFTSFHIELLIAAYGVVAAPGSYADAVHVFFRLMAQRDAAGLRDPLGIASCIPATRRSSAAGLISAVHKAAEHSLCALDAEARRKTPEAVRQWRIVFNHRAFAR